MRTICLAEECEELGHALGAFLGGRGYGVRRFREGSRAWESLLQSPPDLLIVSRELPGLGGLDLLALVGGAGLKIPTVIMTAETSEPVAAEALNLGATCYVVKAAPAEMLGPIEKALERAGHLLDVERENERLIARLRGQNDILEATVADRTAELLCKNEELRSLDKMKSAFITLMSHEIRTPLTSILGFSEIISQGLCESTAELRDVAGQIRGAGRSLCSFVDDLMELFFWLSGSRELAAGPVRLDRVVRSAQDLVAEKAMAKQIVFHVRGEREAQILGDELELVRAVHRILDNAVKFSKRGDRVEIVVSADGEFCELEIIDFGSGIDPSLREAIFRPLEIAGRIENHTQGRGLGLALVAQAVRSHGGVVTVESAGAGRGTTARIRIPVAGSTAPIPGLARISSAV
jgi:signal transduction histidine kinase